MMTEPRRHVAVIWVTVGVAICMVSVARAAGGPWVGVIASASIEHRHALSLESGYPTGGLMGMLGGGLVLRPVSSVDVSVVAAEGSASTDYRLTGGERTIQDEQWSTAIALDYMLTGSAVAPFVGFSGQYAGAHSKLLGAPSEIVVTSTLRTYALRAGARVKAAHGLQVRAWLAGGPSYGDARDAATGNGYRWTRPSAAAGLGLEWMLPAH